jgi:hypothetical protein
MLFDVQTHGCTGCCFLDLFATMVGQGQRMNMQVDPQPGWRPCPCGIPIDIDLPEWGDGKGRSCQVNGQIATSNYTGGSAIWRFEEFLRAAKIRAEVVLLCENYVEISKTGLLRGFNHKCLNLWRRRWEARW